MADPRQQPQRMGLSGHWAYVLLYLTAVLAGLWQHALAPLVLAVVVAVPVCGLAVHVPTRWLPAWIRSALANGLAILGVIWFLVRHQQHTPVDLLLVEGVSIMGLGFLVSAQPRQYAYVFGLSLLLLGYGALLPARVMYVYLVPLAFTLALYLLYRSRLMGLAGQATASLAHGRRRTRPFMVILHLALLLVICYMAFTVFPHKGRRGQSVLPVSFILNGEHQLGPPSLERWFSGRNTSPSESGSWLTEKGERPTAQSRTAETLVDSPDSDSDALLDGVGSGPPGKDVVMRVRCPLKLYWVSRIYDVYDGHGWTVSDDFKQMRTPRLGLRFGTDLTVPQSFVIEKWVSRSLYAAYVPTEWTLSGFTGFRPESAGGPYTKRLSSDVDLPQSGAGYQVNSRLPEPGADAGRGGLRRWYESFKPEHYRQLPQKLVTDRTRQLAEDLTAGATTDLEKITAIRDYLRDFKYTLEFTAPPKGRDAVDYYLFETQKGHCQYSATAMTVLARLAGLPARAVVGFSPGDYDILTGVFEVREYHSHAWCQVWVKDVGWITVDATPPNAPQLQLRETPLVISAFQEPFSDDWRLTAPELSSDTRKWFRDQIAELKAKEDARRLAAATQQDAAEAMAERHASQVRPGVAPDWRNAPSRHRPLVGTFTASVELTALNLREHVATILGRLEWPDFAYAGGCSLLLILSLFLYPRLAYWVNVYRDLRRCEEWFRFAEATAGSNPDACISYSSLALRRLLELSGWRKRNNMDYYEFSAMVAGDDQELGGHAATVFSIYADLRYSPDDPTMEESDTALERARYARDSILDQRLYRRRRQPAKPNAA